MTPAIALLDANVLYPAPLRDLLLQLAVTGLYKARWSAEIDAEWMRNLRADRPHLTAQIGLTHVAMHRAIPDALVTGYEPLVADLALPDPDDRHVLAAAITTGAEIIVTFNLKDFPPALLAPYNVTRQHPDVFLQSFIAAMPTKVLTGARDCLARLQNPPIEAADYLGILRRLGLMETATFLENHLSQRQPQTQKNRNADLR